MKKSAILFILLLSLLFGLSACGDKVEEPAIAATESTVSPVEPEGIEAEPTETEEAEIIMTEPTETEPTEAEPTEEETSNTLQEATEPATITDTPTEADLEISEIELKKYINVTTANLRASAGMGQEIVGKLPYGTEVVINGEIKLTDGKVWYRTVYNDQTAFISASVLSDTKPEPVITTQQTDNSPASTGKSGSGDINILTGEPAKDGDIIGWGYDTEGNKYSVILFDDDNWD